jgi:hypothetical protein
LHDLRRSFRTGLGRLGVQPHVAERLVNHISSRSEMEAIYDQHLYLEEMRDAMNRWEHHIAIPIRHSDAISGIVGYADGRMKLPPKWLPATSNVVSFSKKSAKKSPAFTRGFSLTSL